MCVCVVLWSFSNLATTQTIRNVEVWLVAAVPVWSLIASYNSLEFQKWYFIELEFLINDRVVAVLVVLGIYVEDCATPNVPYTFTVDSYVAVCSSQREAT